MLELWNTKNQRQVFFLFVQNVLRQALHTNTIKMIRVIFLGILSFSLLRHFLRSSCLHDSNGEKS